MPLMDTRVRCGNCLACRLRRPFESIDSFSISGGRQNVLNAISNYLAVAIRHFRLSGLTLSESDRLGNIQRPPSGFVK